NLEQQDNGLYTVQIPIDAKQDQNQRLVSLKIQSNGLKRLNPCYTTDAERWILIDDTSFMTFSDDEQASLGSFSHLDRKSTRLNSSHVSISYAVFCLKKKKE